MNLLIAAALLVSLLGAPLVEASSLCPSPRADTPALSFSIPSFSPGGLDQYCATMVKNGVSLGFTGVTVTPEIAFDRNVNAINPTAAITPGEIARCLETAYEAGLDITYSPHVEDHTQNNGSVWRAKMDIHPDAIYYDVGFGEFMTWLQSHADVISSGDQSIRITLETELEESTTKHPGEWIDFTQKFKDAIKSNHLEDRVTLGIQPNWYPISDPSFWECGHFRSWISSLDWIAPSMYGDWSHTEQGTDQPADHIAEILQRLKREDHFFCRVPEFSSKPWSFGEFGVGTDLQHAERFVPATAQQLSTFMTQREAVFSNLFSWMQEEAPKSGYSRVINFWVVGIYDPVGVYVMPAVVVDPVIQKQVRDYTNWRCNAGR